MLHRLSELISIIKAPKSPSAVLVELEKLKEHEGVNPKYLEELKEEIKTDEVLKFAIAVDENTNIILDGHHRFNALKKLECKKIPVVFVDYNSPEITVKKGKTNEELTKCMVMQAGFTEKKLPPKATRHMIRFHNGLRHISVIEKRVDVPLKKLRGIN